MPRAVLVRRLGAAVVTLAILAALIVAILILA
jgi:hypothetical protein